MKKQTRLQLLCAVGKQRKTIQLNLVSNQSFTMGEFNAYRKACESQNSTPFVSRERFNRHVEDREKLLSGMLESKEIDKLIRKRLDENIRQGNFSAISNIPYELSRLQQDIDTLQTQIKTFSD